jgi:hypothetical protein
LEDSMMKATGMNAPLSRGAKRGKAPFVVGPIALVLGFAVVACEKDEPPPPLPSAPPAASPPATVDLQIVEEDAAVDAEEEKKVGGGRPASSLGACCAALAQNAENAPEPNKSYMKTAATVCKSAAAAGQTQSAAQAMIRAALQTAGMPTACK